MRLALADGSVIVSRLLDAAPQASAIDSNPGRADVDGIDSNAARFSRSGRASAAGVENGKAQADADRQRQKDATPCSATGGADAQGRRRLLWRSVGLWSAPARGRSSGQILAIRHGPSDGVQYRLEAPNLPRSRRVFVGSQICPWSTVRPKSCYTPPAFGRRVKSTQVTEQ
jgi:hypothetical protein